MIDAESLIALTIFTVVIGWIIWRPNRITLPTSLGALAFLLVGIVPLPDITRIIGIVSGASVTILSTIVMSAVLESIGFFH